MSKDRRLGRGLAALLGSEPDSMTATSQHADGQPLPNQSFPGDVSVDRELGGELEGELGREPDGQDPRNGSGGIILLNVHDIDDNPFQPRRDFGTAEITSLAESLKEHDMLQPILVRSIGDRHQLISGERRLRAAIQAGWSTVPAQVRDADDRLVAELAIVENLQRKDLNPIEKALSFKQYLDQHACTQEELAGRLKIDRSTVSNLVRLLELPESVVQAVQTGKLTAGHARALLPLGDEPLQSSYAQQIIKEQWSVRNTEQQIQERIASEDGHKLRVVGGAEQGGSRKANEQIAALEQQLRTALGTRVDIRQSARGKGKIVVHFTSHQEFERIRNTLTDPQTAKQGEIG